MKQFYVPVQDHVPSQTRRQATHSAVSALIRIWYNNSVVLAHLFQAYLLKVDVTKVVSL